MTPPRPPARLSALEALGALLDRSVARISGGSGGVSPWTGPGADA
ncbi:hypothetical protein [Nocardiopsis ganjiahuensis]|nr:hypothetical protein [Nocardiopsis ganjiahuensis]